MQSAPVHLRRNEQKTELIYAHSLSVLTDENTCSYRSRKYSLFCFKTSNKSFEKDIFRD